MSQGDISDMTFPTFVIADVAMIMRQDRSRQSLFLQSLSHNRSGMFLCWLLGC